jgi:hypothetical protein
MGEKRDSAVIPARTIHVVDRCDEIVNAAAALVVNLEFVSERVDDESRAALQDARESVDRIVQITRTIRLGQRGAPAVTTDEPMRKA